MRRPWQDKKEQAVKLIAVDGKPAIQVYIPPKRYNQTEWRRCQTFLLDLLSKGPLLATQAKEAAQLAGFSDSIIRQSKERSDIQSEYRGTPEKHGVWWWRLPDERDKPWWAKDEDYEPEPDEIARIVAQQMGRSR